MRLPLSRYQHLVLFAVLLGLLLAAWETPGSLLGRVLWVADVGLFLLWQPIVSPERRLSPLQIGIVFGLVLVFASQLSWNGLAAWTAFLCALVGGKVVLARNRRLGWFYLLAFGFLCFALFAWISPLAVSDSSLGLRYASDQWIPWVAVGMLVLLLALLPHGVDEGPAAVYDFLISFVILLVISVVLMRTHTLVVVDHLSHIEAVVQALLSFGLLLLLLSWAWNPRLGFSGFGALASRYLLRLGFPFEEWLGRLTELSDREPEPYRFLEYAAASFLELPWVSGGNWTVPGQSGRFGHEEGFLVELHSGDIELRLFASYRWTAALIWQVNLLLRLVMELYRTKQRDRLLQKMQYVQAVHETGSRVTHDVKNLLQSLDSICFALETVDSDCADELAELMRRQLPAVTQRLRSTLGKLSGNAGEVENRVDLAMWWDEFQQRYQGQDIVFATLSSIGGQRIVQLVFDNVADNLLGNALQKRISEPSLKISVELEAVGDAVTLRVSDDGEPFSPVVETLLFHSPVPSANGLGIGLYHAAELSKRVGYVLKLIENRPGSVRLALIVDDAFFNERVAH